MPKATTERFALVRVSRGTADLLRRISRASGISQRRLADGAILRHAKGEALLLRQVDRKIV